MLEPARSGLARQFGRFDLENDKIACQLMLVRLAADAVADDDDKVTARNKLSFLLARRIELISELR